MNPDPNDTFEQFLDQNEKLIRRLARDNRWRIPWQDVEETEADLAIVLYEAFLHHKPTVGPFQAYWNTLWARFRAKAIRNSMRQKRSVLIVVTPMDHRNRPDPNNLSDDDESDLGVASGATPVSPEPVELPRHARGIDPLEEVVWNSLQHGFTPTEVIDLLPITRARYYALIKAWKERLVRGHDIGVPR